MRDVPETEALREQKVLSLEPFEVAIGKYIAETPTIDINLSSEEAEHFINKHPQFKNRPMSGRAIAMKLSKIFGKAKEDKSRHRTRVLPIEKARSLFCEHIKIDDYFDENDTYIVEDDF